MPEPLRWIRAVRSVRRRVPLPADPVLIECHRVDVNLAQIRIPQHCAGWQVVLDEPEAQRLESMEQILEPVEYNHDVHILVLPRLNPEKRLNSPPAVQPDLKRGSLKGVQYREDLLGEHVTVLAL